MALHIDGKVIELSGIQDNLAKAEVSQAWDRYGSGDEKITFDKKGSELKGILTVKKYQLEEVKNTCMAKMAAMKKEIGESKSGQREGHVDNIDVFTNESLPHDTVKQLTEEEQMAYRAYRDAMYKVQMVERDLKIINTLLKHLDDTKKYKVNLQQLQSIEKSDISYAFSNNYGEDKPLTFKKKGSDIKAMLVSKIAGYEMKKMELTTKAAALLSMLSEKGYKPEGNGDEPIREGGDDSERMERFGWNQYEQKEGNNIEKDCRIAMQNYNEICYAIEGFERDTKAAQIIIENMEDNKSYPLNIRQITAISKGGTSDEITKAANGAKAKVAKVMKEFKAGTLTSNGKPVTDKKQAVAIAMSEAGIDKDAFEKFYNLGGGGSADNLGDHMGSKTVGNADDEKMKKGMDDAFAVLGVEPNAAEVIEKAEPEAEEIEKGQVKGHWKTTSSGRKVYVKPHSDSRTKKEGASSDEKSKTLAHTKEINKLKEKRNKLPKDSSKRDAIQSKIDSMESMVKRDSTGRSIGLKNEGDKIDRSKKNPDLVSVAKHKELLNDLISDIKNPKSKTSDASYKEAKTMADDLSTLDSAAGKDYKSKVDNALKERDGGGKKSKKHETSNYHETLSSAIEDATKMAESRGYEVDEDDMFSRMSVGGIKYEETKSESIGLTKDGKEQKKMLQMTVYRMPSGKYELTAYIN